MDENKPELDKNCIHWNKCDQYGSAFICPCKYFEDKDDKEETINE